jgi:hypothetical protein
VFFTCVLFLYSVNAQKVSVVADREKILIGEQIVVQLKLEDVNTQNFSLEKWFTLNDSIPHIQVVKKDTLDTVDINGLSTYLQKITITSFDSGRWAVAPMQVVLQNRATGKETVLGSDSIFIDVLPVDVSGLQEYHPLKDILEVKAKPDYFLIAIIAISVILLAVLTWLFIKQFKKKKLQPVKPAYKASALENAIRKIKELSKHTPATQEQMKIFYGSLSDICREYFQEQLHIKASYITSDELMIAIIVYLQNETKRTSFFQLLRLIDAVKFAKYVPASSQQQEAIETAIASLQHIDQQIKQTKQHDN